MENESYNELAELAGGFIHELKNHLSTLGLNLQLLSEDFDTPQSQKERRGLERVNRLQEECQRLVDKSNDFLRFAQVNDLDLKPTGLSALVEEIIDFFSPTAQSSQIEIKRFFGANLPPVQLDGELFKQALLNLLLNAQQAMPEGGAITVQTARDPRGVTISFIDTGKGMPADVVRRAFKPFYTTRSGGSGLGLPTTRKIIEAHGGSIEIESEPGHGTKFSIHLPAQGAGSATTNASPLANVHGRLMPLDQVQVSALDRGFLFGDSVYEVLRVYRGRPFLLDEHWQRLDRSLQAIRIEGVDLARLRNRMLQTLSTSGCDEAIIYLHITRGAAPRSHAFPAKATPLEFLFVQPFQDPYQEARKVGVSVSLQPDLRWKRCDIKSTNLLGNVLAIQQAKEAGHLEALLHTPDGYLTECSHMSFMAVQDGTIVLTPLGPQILPGITRAYVLTLAERIGIPVQTRQIHRDELATLDELFLTGTTSEVLPINRVDEQVIGTGQVGTITQRLQEAYLADLATFGRTT